MCERFFCAIITLTIVSVHLVGVMTSPAGAFLCAGNGGDQERSRAAKRLMPTMASSSEPINGTYHALVVFARFADDPPQRVPAWADSLFRPDLPGSVAHYYEDQSFGRLHLRGTVLPTVYASRDPRATYLAATATGWGDVSRFVREVLDRVDADVDFRRFDGNGDGTVDLVVVLLVGKAIPNFIRGGATGVGWLGGGSAWPTADGVAIAPVSGVAAVVQSFPHAVGSVAHELGHWLGLPDLYDLSAVGVDVGRESAGRGRADPAEDSAGIGVWGIMGWGALGWDGAGTSHPTPLGAWEREQLGWAGPPGEEDLHEVVTPQAGVHLAPVAAGGGLLKVWMAPLEYFLLEVRDPTAGYYERGCPGRGVLIWHVDAQGNQGEEQWKRVDVECADGRYREAGYPLGHIADPGTGGDNLDFWSHDDAYRLAHRGNWGDVTDLYDGVRFTAFTPTTNPTTQRNDGEPSGLAITNIRLDPSGASCDIGGWDGTPVMEVGALRVTDATGDGLLEPGETGQAAVFLTNGGMAPAGRIELTVGWDRPGVEPFDTTISRLMRYVGDTTIVVVPLRVTAPLTAGTTITLTVTITPERGEVQIRRLTLSLIIPDMQILGMTVLDGGQSGLGWGNGDGIPNPGEVVSLDLRVRSRSGWQPWSFPGARIRFPDLPGDLVERQLGWQERRADSTGTLQMQGEVVLPAGLEDGKPLRGILELLGQARGVGWVDTLVLTVRGQDTTPPRIRDVQMTVEEERLRLVVPAAFVEEGGEVVRLVARLVRLSDSTEVATVPLRPEEARFVGVWVFPFDLGGAMFGVVIEATDDAGNTETTGVLQRVTFREGQSVASSAMARLGKGTVTQVAYAPDGTVLAVAGSVGIWLYDAITLAEVGLLRGAAGEVTTMAFSPDGRLLASGSGWRDTTVRLWDVASRRGRAVLEGHTRGVTTVVFSPDGQLLASAGYDSTIRLWDVVHHREVAVLRGHTGGVIALTVSPDGQLLASASYDSTIRLWDVVHHREVAVLRGHTGWVAALIFSPDGTVLASGSDDRTVRLWDVIHRTGIATLQGHRSRIRAVIFSPDGTLLASVDGDRTMRLWDVTFPQEVAVMHVWGNSIGSIAFSPDGTLLALGGKDGTVRLWEAESRREVTVLTGHTREVMAVVFSPDGARLASVSWDATVRLWDVARQTEVAVLKGYTIMGVSTMLSAMTFSRDGTTLMVGSEDGTIHLWDVVSHQERTVLQVHTNQFSSPVFSPGGTMFAWGSGDGILLWDITHQQTIRIVKKHPPFIPRSLAFNPDGAILAAGLDSTIHLWDVTYQTEIATLHGHTGEVTALAFSPDGTILASGSDDRTVRLWDLVNRREITTLRGHRGGISTVGFSPEGYLLASGSDDGTVRLWDVASSQAVTVLQGYTSRVTVLTFRPDGTILAVGTGDGSIHLWDVVRRQEVAVLRGHTGQIVSMTFSPDGTILASGSLDGTVLLWEARPTGVEAAGGDEPAIPSTYALAQNAPNPFNPVTAIRYTLPEAAHIRLVIYDLTGRKVRTLVQGYQQPGWYTVVWDGRDAKGWEVASGVYFYRLEAVDRGFVETRRMILVR